jgi:hypothetical protein
MVKNRVPFGKFVLSMGQYVRSIHLLWEDLWVYNVNKWDCYSHSLHLIKRLDKQLQKLCVITAERFPHGFLFTMLIMNEPVMV